MKGEGRIRWVPATLIALIGVLVVAAVAEFLCPLWGNEFVAMVAMAAAIIALPLALYLLPLESWGRIATSCVLASWRSAPLRKVNCFLAVLALLVPV